MLSHISKTMGWPFTIVYLALIAGALYFTFVTVPERLNSNDWPQVTGEVTKSEVTQRTRRHKNGKTIKVYSAKVHYQYTTDGKPYNNQSVMLADRQEANIQAAIEKQYPVGKKFNVYYNPENPSDAVLEPGLTTDHIITGLFLLVSIFAMAFALYRNAARRKR